MKNMFFLPMFQISVRNPESGELADDRLPTDDSAALEIEFVQVEPKTDGTSYAVSDKILYAACTPSNRGHQAFFGHLSFPKH